MSSKQGPEKKNEIAQLVTALAFSLEKGREAGAAGPAATGGRSGCGAGGAAA